jgi:hypothetical protein
MSLSMQQHSRFAYNIDAPDKDLPMPRFFLAALTAAISHKNHREAIKLLFEFMRFFHYFPHHAKATKSQENIPNILDDYIPDILDDDSIPDDDIPDILDDDSIPDDDIPDDNDSHDHLPYIIPLDDIANALLCTFKTEFEAKVPKVFYADKHRQLEEIASFIRNEIERVNSWEDVGEDIGDLKLRVENVYDCICCELGEIANIFAQTKNEVKMNMLAKNSPKIVEIGDYLITCDDESSDDDEEQ